MIQGYLHAWRQSTTAVQKLCAASIVSEKLFITRTQDEVPEVGADSGVRDLYQSPELEFQIEGIRVVTATSPPRC
jgi:hypothetical protein